MVGFQGTEEINTYRKEEKTYIKTARRKKRNRKKIKHRIGTVPRLQEIGTIEKEKDIHEKQPDGRDIQSRLFLVVLIKGEDLRKFCGFWQTPKYF